MTIYKYTFPLEIALFWVVTWCSVAVGYHRFGARCCFHLQGPKTTLHGIRTQKTTNSIFTAIVIDKMGISDSDRFMH